MIMNEMKMAASRVEKTCGPRSGGGSVTLLQAARGRRMDEF